MRAHRQREGVDRSYAIVLAVAAATVGIASYLHLDGRITLGFATIAGEHFGLVSLPEAVISAALLAGGLKAALAPDRAGALVRGVIGFAAVGVLVGMVVTLVGSPHIAADLAYHLVVEAGMLTALLSLRSSSKPELKTGAQKGS